MPEAGDEKKQGKREKLYFEGGHIIACTEYASKAFGVTAATLANWAAAGCPKHSYGYWDIIAVADYLREQDDMKAAAQACKDPGGLSLSQQKMDAERQLKEANLEKVRLQNEIARGEYLRRADVVANLTELLLILKSSLQGLGAELMREVARHVEPDEERRLALLVTDTVADGLRQLSVDGVYRARS